MAIEGCKHETFAAQVDVNRLGERDDGSVSKYMADVRVTCAQCGSPFHFVGLGRGLSFSSPMASVDATELHAPIAPGPGPLPDHMTYEVSTDRS